MIKYYPAANLIEDIILDYEGNPSLLPGLIRRTLRSNLPAFYNQIQVREQLIRSLIESHKN